MNPYKKVAALAMVLVLILGAGVALVNRLDHGAGRVAVTAYFPNTNGMFVGDDVRILGVTVGKIARIEPQPQRVKVSFWFDDKYPVPADAKAVILSPSLVTARAIQLTPAYTKGQVMRSGAVISEDRTAVPVEFDDLRQQLEKLSSALQPTEPGGVSTLGAFINTAADNLRGQGANVRDTLVKLAQAFSALGDHSTDVFSTVKNLAILVSALQASTDLMRQLNQNLASVTGSLSNGPNEIADAVNGLNGAVEDVKSFIEDNRNSLSTTSQRLASVSQALVDSEDDLKQTLHVAPTAFQNFVNIYAPAQGAFAGVVAVNNFANPISFLCGAIQAASRLGAEQSAKLCVQYLAPILKNRQYNFPPIGQNPFVGARTRPNELTYSEDWMRPDYVPPSGPAGNAAPRAAEAPIPNSAGRDPGPPPPPSEAHTTNPADGLRGLMTPPEGHQ